MWKRFGTEGRSLICNYKESILDDPGKNVGDVRVSTGPQFQHSLRELHHQTEFR